MDSDSDSTQRQRTKNRVTKLKREWLQGKYETIQQHIQKIDFKNEFSIRFHAYKIVESLKRWFLYQDYLGASRFDANHLTEKLVKRAGAFLPSGDLEKLLDALDEEGHNMYEELKRRKRRP
tara:strand:+ start:10810 stop:11172 length:363 start_codon:yes stop_codon:yes gene_type:complete